MTKPQPHPGILTIAPYVPGRGKLPGMDKILKLASNEGALGPSPKAVEAYRKLAGELHRYPDGDPHDLRHAIARRHGLDPDRIVCGNGSDELIMLIARCYAGPGDEVLHTVHGFLMYPIFARAVGATPVAAPERDYTTDVDALLARVTPRTKIVYLANPNNPTGTYVPAAELARLRAGLPGHVLLVIDAAYAEYIGRNDYSTGRELVDRGGNTIMLRTFSKIYGLAAVRLGWAYVPAEIADVMNRVRNPFNVNAPAQAAGIAALDDVEFIARGKAHNDRWLPWLAAEVAGLGLRVVPSIGNFLLVEFPPDGKTAAAANDALNKRGITVRPVGAYGLPHHLRITVGLEAENRAVVDGLAAFMRS